MPLHWVRADDYEAMSSLAAERMFAAIERRAGQRQPMLVGLATGNTMLSLYDRLAGMLNRRNVDLSRLHTVNLDEYVGANGQWIPADHPLSYRGYMQKNLFSRFDSRLGMNREHIHFPDPTQPTALDEWIRGMGRVDFQLLGIGFNGHIGFNEPIPETTISVEAYGSLPSRVVGLTELTIDTNARLTAGGDHSKVPRHAVTLGMAPILAAKEILLLACFPQQREPLLKLRQGRVTPELPGSYLINHPNTTIIYAEDQVGLEKGL